MAVIALGNAFQAWVLEPSALDVRRRHRLAIISHVGLGAVGGLGIALLGPLLTGIVFGTAVAAAPIPSLLYGVAFFFLSSTTPLIRNILIPAQRYRTVFMATIASAVVGISTMVLGSALGSAGLVALGVAAAEATSFVVLIRPARRTYPSVIAAAQTPLPPPT
jgi:PST family polysaccharide transporter